MRKISWLIALPLLACSGPSTRSAGTEAAPAAAAEAVLPCNVPVAVGEEWRLVEAGEFTFCVPSTWRVRAARAVHTGGNIEWKRGASPRLSFTVTGVSSGRMPPTSSAPSGRREHLTEVIAGRSVELWRMPWLGKLTTGATWTDPAVHFVGEANTEDIASKQLDVYRTVRFVRR